MSASQTNPFVYPQSPAAPISTNFLRDEANSVETVDKEASGPQRVIAIGSPIPIVFGRVLDGNGGVWVNPPAARYGLQLSDTTGNDFATGLVVSDGQIEPVNKADIYKGGFTLLDLSGDHTNAYGVMPTLGYNYTFSETTVIPGTPGTDDTVVPGTSTFSINQSNWGSWTSSNFRTFVTRSNTKSVSVSMSVYDDYSSKANSLPFAWQVRASNTVVGSGSSSGSASFSYDAGSDTDWIFEIRATSSSAPNLAKLYVTGSGTKKSFTVIPGTPVVPPVYTTTGLPLSPGSGGSFNDMSCLAVKGTYPAGGVNNDYREQIRCFVRNGIQVKSVINFGIGSSSNFMDLAYYLLKANKISDELIDLDGFRAAHRFLYAQGLYYNGVVSASVNLREFFASVAPGLMLRFVQDSGKFSFKPVLPLDSDNRISNGNVAAVKTFDNDNIIVGSYSKTFYDSNMRKPFCALVSWREQTKQNYSAIVSSEVRYQGSALYGPYETYDYMDFITDLRHATSVGRYILSSRARITHSIKFSTYFDAQTTGGKLAGQLAPMDVIRVAFFSEANGGVAETDRFYQVESISESGNGQLEIEAVHFPADAGGTSLIAADVTSSEDLPVPPPLPQPPTVDPKPPVPPVVPDPPKGTIGVLSVAFESTGETGKYYYAGMRITLVASISGDAVVTEYQWAGPAGSAAPMGTTTGNTLTWIAAGAGDGGTYTVTAVAPSATDSPKRVGAELRYEPFIIASGGLITFSGNYKIHTFTSGGQFNIDYAPGSTQGIEYLIVGPGGNGSPRSSAGNLSAGIEGGGGGGGGGVLTGSKTISSAASYTIQVGTPGGWNQTKGSTNNSSAFGITAISGGDGCVFTQSIANGASGGGAADPTRNSNMLRGNGSQGNSGGYGKQEGFLGATGGGGGATGAGGTGSVNSSGGTASGGNGGQGRSSSISGANYVYGSGGGGFAYSKEGGGVGGSAGSASGGLGGTGAGRGAALYLQVVDLQNQFVRVPATPATNYGAGGSGGDSNNSGVQGIVIVRYLYK